jgi:hypothetical protein
MKSKGGYKGFSVSEAKQILQVLEGFWFYCVQSVEWYEDGGKMVPIKPPILLGLDLNVRAGR